ncbi:phage major capsid protein [Streptomyces soliscabiei]|uniref:phage major capsid protein n=1 Tax=Streptomyces soliscabiei TaxID=588897 RepID=UPI0029A36C91|nr:phage major capsid protein [Streptomyces sp. NY05-11A]MDX2676183.1 phage major capsid protein [Streptomyces sp. NY05-11A]
MARRTLPAPFDEMCERFGVRSNGALLIRELKAKRTEREDQARELTKRGKLNATEERQFNSLMDERDDLDELVTQAEERLEDDRGRRDDDGERGRGNAPALYFHTADGGKVRGVRHGESFARAAGTPARIGQDATEELSVGRALLGILRGDYSVMEREMRAQVIAQDPAGGFFVTPTLGSLFIDKARAMSIVSQAGAITIPLGSSETRILRTDTDPTAEWKAELQALHSTDVKFGAVVLYPKVLGCIADISEELIEDGGPNAAAQIEAVLSQAVASQLDRSFWRGVSGGAADGDVAGRYFTGILDDPDVNTVDMAGAAPTDYDEWIDAIQLVEDANGTPTVRIDSPRTAAQLAKLKETSTGAYLKAPDSVAALRHLKTTQTPVTLGGSNNQSVSVVGNFATGYVIIGIRSAFRIEVSNQAGDAFENLGRKVRVWGRADMAIGRPSHLTLVQAIGPSS